MNCTCQLCGYNWYNQRYGKTPSRCPACHSRRWNINPFDGIPDKHLINELNDRGYNVTAKIGISNFPLVLPNGKTPAGELPNGNIPEAAALEHTENKKPKKKNKKSKMDLKKEYPELIHRIMKVPKELMIHTSLENMRDYYPNDDELKEVLDAELERYREEKPLIIPEA